MSLAGLADVTQVEASNCGMGTAGAKAFGDVLRVNKTLQHLNVSNNSFGRPVVGDQVKLKSSGEMCTVTYINIDGSVDVKKADGSRLERAGRKGIRMGEPCAGFLCWIGGFAISADGE